MKDLIYLLIILSGLIQSCESPDSSDLKDNSSIVQNSDNCYQLEKNSYKGNYLKKLEQDKNGYLIDKIDDTLNFTKLKENIYQDKDSLIYIRCEDKSSFWGNSECPKISIEYFKDYSAFINRDDYKLLDDMFFINNGKVFIWWVNSETKFPVEIKNANPNTFKIINEACCGYDNKGLYYGDPSFKINQILIDNPEQIEFLPSSSSCWNCNFHYVKILNEISYLSYNEKISKFTLSKISGVNSKTFKIINGKEWDAEDDKNKYLKGKIIDR